MTASHEAQMNARQPHVEPSPAAPRRRRIRRVVRIGVIIVLVSSLSLTGLLLWWSPGIPEPFLDANDHRIPGSISQKLSVPINGVQQGMVIRCENKSNPKR
jgi:hypothetical protein